MGRLPAPVPRFAFVPERPARGAFALLPGQQRVYVRYLAWQHDALAVAAGLHRTTPFDLVHHVSWGSLQGGSQLGRLGVPFVFGPVGGGQVAPFRFLPWFGRSAVNELARTVLTNTLAAVIGNGRTVARQASIVLAVNRDTLDLARRLGSRRTELFLESGIERSLRQRAARARLARASARAALGGAHVPAERAAPRVGGARSGTARGARAPHGARGRTGTRSPEAARHHPRPGGSRDVARPGGVGRGDARDGPGAPAAVHEPARDVRGAAPRSPGPRAPRAHARSPRCRRPRAGRGRDQGPGRATGPGARRDRRRHRTCRGRPGSSASDVGRRPGVGARADVGRQGGACGGDLRRDRPDARSGPTR